MPSAQVEFEKLKIKGEAFCIGGQHPTQPIDKYPMLAWLYDHPKFGRMTVFLEDHSASVEQVALALVELHAFDAVAKKFGTSLDHVEQAVKYAEESGYMGV
jgi:hypothetical protein